MIKFEHLVLPSPEQMDFVIESMRNIDGSWNNSDSGIGCDGNLCASCGFEPDWCGWTFTHIICHDDLSLMRYYAYVDKNHIKFMKMMPVYVRITAPSYFWDEFCSYEFDIVSESCSLFNKVREKEFTLDDFSCEDLSTNAMYLFGDTIRGLNDSRQCFLETKSKDIWRQMIRLLPSNYNQTRNVMMDYKTLIDIYRACAGHDVDEWIELRKWIESLPYSELICGPEFIRKKFNIPEETIDKFNAIGNPNPLSSDDIREIMRLKEK